MRRSFITGLIAIVIVSALTECGGGGSPVTQGTTGADPRLDGSYRAERNGWIYVHVQGEPDRLGFQHGYLLAPEIAELLRVVKPLLQQLTKKDWAFYRKAADEIVWPKVDPEYQREIDGIVAGMTAHGATADRSDIVALNGMMELAYYYVPWLDKRQGRKPTVTSPNSCSAFIATGAFTSDQRIVMGHNAWTDYIVGSRWNVMFDLVPSDGQRIVMDGLPGVIVSDDDFGINSAGLMITETTITAFTGFDPSGVPEFSRARKALQYSSSIDEFAKTMLEGNNGGYANDWLVGDNKTGEIARFELGLKHHSLERTASGYFAGSNFPVDKALIKAETTFNASNSASSANARHTRWDQLMAEHKGRIDVETGKKLEADAYDVIENKAGPTERSLCGTVETSPRGIPEWDWPAFFPGGTVQAKVTSGALAEKMTIWGAMGRPCAPDFAADEFLSRRPQFAWTRGLLRDMKSQPWTQFTAGMK